MTEQRHAALGLHSVEAGEHGELLKRRQIVRNTKIITVVILVLLACGAARTVFVRLANALAATA